MHDRTLPPRPDLAQYRKQAKQLLKAFAAGDADVLTRIRRHHPRWRESSDPDPPLFKLADAQLVIAREHGVESWPKFVGHIEAVNAQQSAAANNAETTAKPALLRIAVAGAELDAELGLAAQARGLVLLVHASGSSRYRPASRFVASAFNQAAFTTVSVDLLTDDEELNNGELEHDFHMLGTRLLAVTDWIAQQPLLSALPLGYWAAGIGAAAMVFAAGERAAVVRAVVSSGGRPDLAGSSLWKLKAPTLLIAGGADRVGLGFNKLSASIFAPYQTYSLQVIAGATQRFETPEARDEATALACDWFHHYLSPQEG